MFDMNVALILLFYAPVKNDEKHQSIFPFVKEKMKFRCDTLHFNDTDGPDCIVCSMNL